MKKLLFAAMVTMGFAHDASAMLFRKSHQNQNMPVFQPEVDIAGEQWKKQVIQEPLLDQLHELNGDARKAAIKSWCDAFKKNSKRPVMWGNLEDVQEKKIEKSSCCVFEKSQGQDVVNNLMSEVVRLNYDKLLPVISDIEFLGSIKKLQNDEWNAWQTGSDDEILGVQCELGKWTRPWPGAHLQMSKDDLKSFIVFNQSPYYKKYRNDTSNLANELENNMYHESLRSLQITKAVIERDLHNQSYFQRIWNYTQRQNSWQALARVSEEIALFKDQDRVVSPEKVVPTGELTECDDVRGESSNGSVISYQRRVYKGGAFTTMPQLTHRDVFTRSNMQRTMFEQVKTARE